MENTARQQLETLYYKILEFSWIRPRDVDVLRSYYFCEDSELDASLSALQELYMELLKLNVDSLQQQQSVLNDFVVQAEALQKNTDRLTLNITEHVDRASEDVAADDLLKQLI